MFQSDIMKLQEPHQTESKEISCFLSTLPPLIVYEEKNNDCPLRSLFFPPFLVVTYAAPGA